MAGCCDLVHESNKKVHGFLLSLGYRNTYLERMARQKNYCRFGEQGICCTLCPDGPCRIRRRAPLGRCGIDADGIAARNLLRLVINGGSAYTHDFKYTLKTIKAMSEGKSPFEVKDREKLRWFMEALSLPYSEEDDKKNLKELHDFLERELLKDVDEPLTLVERLAPKSRVELWKSLGILPGGFLKEAHEASAKIMPNVDTDFLDLALTALRLGISAGFLANVASTVFRDIVFGSPSVNEGYADLGVLDKDYVNIVVHGHVPWTGSVVAQLAKTEEFQKLAREAGAKGIKVYGSLCTGQELIQRPETSKYIDGQVGNWLSQEFLAGTGVVDVFVLDKNCAAPGLNNMVSKLKLHTKLISVSSVVKLREVDRDEKLVYDPVNVMEQAKYIILKAIETFKQRKKASYIRFIPENKTKYIAGFGVESILQKLGGTPQPLLDAINEGLIKGVVGLVSCVTMRNGHGAFTYNFVRELLRRDILVLIAGCASSMAQIEGFTNLEAIEKYAGDGLKKVCKDLEIPPVLNFGSCLDTGRMALLITALSQYTGLDPSRLPVIAAAPEYYNNDAYIDGLLAVALGVNVYINPPPPITGAPSFTRLMTRDIEDYLGARFLVKPDPLEAAELVEKELIAKIS